MGDRKVVIFKKSVELYVNVNDKMKVSKFSNKGLMMMPYTISQLAKEFNVTTRTIRYYEELRLLKPERSDSGRRLYSKSDVTRLTLIFRGKRFGFTLEQIKEMIHLFDQDRSGRKQLERTVEYGNMKIEEITSFIQELETMRTEMEELRDDFLKKLNESGENRE
ncbi:MerR family transcriptional regulator [Rossellomorea vietnamensis]|uniref:MerR family transcriptional regulator n=1 Tax=Rossellomorea vietnamensis TaxID=218284 RepID=UPI000A7D13E6